jgi:hypothetical protein
MSGGEAAGLLTFLPSRRSRVNSPKPIRMAMAVGGGAAGVTERATQEHPDRRAAALEGGEDQTEPQPLAARHPGQTDGGADREGVESERPDQPQPDHD